MTTSYSITNISTFYSNFLSGSLSPEASSESLPNYTELISNIDSLNGAVLPIVRSNFFARTIGTTNNPVSDDVVVIFINDNIDFNNTIMLYFLEVAKYYSSRAPKMQFYKINMSLNDLPELNIDENSRLPAIKLYSNKNAKAKPYDFHDDIANYVDSVDNYKSFLEKYKFNPLVN